MLLNGQLYDSLQAYQYYLLYMTVCLLVKKLSEFRGVDEITIVRETQSIRRVDIEGLGFRRCLLDVRSERIVTPMPNANRKKASDTIVAA